jgi:hypothetical protein
MINKAISLLIINIIIITNFIIVFIFIIIIITITIPMISIITIITEFVDFKFIRHFKIKCLNF